jgi:hypothetical protein
MNRKKKPCKGILGENKEDLTVILGHKVDSKVREGGNGIGSIFQQIDQHFTSKPKRETLTDIISQKRTLLRLQLSIDVTTEEIHKLERAIRSKEAEILHVEHQNQAKRRDVLENLEVDMIETERVLMLMEDMESRMILSSEKERCFGEP